MKELSFKLSVLTLACAVGVLLCGSVLSAQGSTSSELSSPANVGNLYSASDRDEDGLEDDIEQQLIDRFRPYYLFDHANDKWAASVLWYVTRSKLQYRTVDNTVTPPVPYNVLIHTPEELAADPSLVLKATIVDPFTHETVSSNSTVLPNPIGFYIHPYSSVDAGGQGECVDVGCYAHVMPIDLPVRRGNYPAIDNTSHKGILIQFCQFFPYNDSQSSWGGDREGDWVYMDIYVGVESHLTDYARSYIFYLDLYAVKSQSWRRQH